MKKKFITILFCVVVVFVLLFLWLRGINVRLFDDITSDDIEKIIIYHPGDSENIFADPEDKEKVLGLLREMHLNRTLPNVGSGGLMMSIYYEDGAISSLTLFSNIIVVDNGVYSCDRDYCDDFRELCKGLQNP